MDSLKRTTNVCYKLFPWTKSVFIGRFQTLVRFEETISNLLALEVKLEMALDWSFHCDIYVQNTSSMCQW